MKFISVRVESFSVFDLPGTVESGTVTGGGGGGDQFNLNLSLNLKILQVERNQHRQVQVSSRIYENKGLDCSRGYSGGITP